MKRRFVLKTIATGGGYCCEHAFLADYGLQGQDELSDTFKGLLAAHIGVTARTIRVWNLRIRCKLYPPCDECITRKKLEMLAEKIS